MDYQEALRTHLVELLNGHGVEAEVKGDSVYVPATNATLRLMVVNQYPTGTVLMGCTASRDDQPEVTDLWAGVGSTVHESVIDGVRAFCAQDFHVLLASHGGLLERDQVQYDVIEKGDRTWDLYTGPMVGRTSEEADIQLHVDWSRVVSQIRDVANRRVHAFRLFVSVLNGEVTYEALMDGEEQRGLLDLLRQFELDAPQSGYSSQRLFACLVERLGGEPAHQKEGVCAD
jgi:hypothetical protein